MHGSYQKSTHKPIKTTMTKIGFHYFHDTQHYRKSDLSTWLPALRKMRAKWLVLEAPLHYALFLKRLCTMRCQSILFAI
jgi:hypothetical protein